MTFDPANIQLTERQADCLVFIKQIYMTEGMIPSVEKIADVFDVSVATAKKWLDSEAFKHLLLRQGVMPAKIDGVLSAPQLAIAEMLLDLNDKRSKREKCEAAGISVNQLAVWRKDATFNGYMQRRAKDLFHGSNDIAYMSVLKNMDNGDMNATRLYMEMTGQYQPAAHRDVDLGAFLNSVIEILQVEIQDPATLERIAEHFDNLLSGKPVVLEQRNTFEAIPVASVVVEDAPVEESDPYMIKPDFIGGMLDFGSLS